MITDSAIRVTQEGKEPIMVTGKRHCNCFETIYEMGIRRPFQDEQGFMTDEGEFLTRERAFKYAMIQKQITYPIKYGTLFSEDLW